MMTIWSRLMAMLPGERGNERNPLDQRWWGQPGVMSAAGTPVTPEMVEQLDVVQACLENIAGSISTLPKKVFKRVGKSDAGADDNVASTEEDREEVQNHPIAKLLNHPNDRQSSQEFHDEMLRHLAFYRNFYAEIVPGADGSPFGALEIIHPLRMYRVERQNGRIWYHFRDVDGVSTRTLRDDEIWHVRKAPLTRDGLRGRPVYETSKETFGKAIAVEDYGAKFFKNGTNGGIIELPGQFKDKEEQQNFLDAWREAGGGINRHRDRILKGGAKYNWNQVQNEQAQFLETVKQLEIKCARIWLMPPHRIGVLDRATFSNIEQQSVEFVVYCLAPFLTAIEQSAHNTFLFGNDQYFIEYNIEGLLRGDLKSLYAAFAQGRQWGWLSVNDILRALHRKTIGPKGDVYLEPQNMKPAGEEPDDDDKAGSPGAIVPQK